MHWRVMKKLPANSAVFVCEFVLTCYILERSLSAVAKSLQHKQALLIFIAVLAKIISYQIA